MCLSGLPVKRESFLKNSRDLYQIGAFFVCVTTRELSVPAKGKACVLEEPSSFSTSSDGECEVKCSICRKERWDHAQQV